MYLRKSWSTTAIISACLVFSCTKGLEYSPLNIASNQASQPEIAAGVTIDDLRNQNVVSSVKYTTTDFGGGNWVYDTLDKKSLDNTGTVLVTKFGQRLKRSMTTQVVNALWFGLKTDGSDQTDVLQAAIYASSGNTLQMPAGTYFTKQLSIISNIVIIGNNTKLRMIQGSYDNSMIKLTGITNVRISAMEIALNGISGNMWDGTSAIQLQNCSNVQIDNCFIHDNTYVGIRLIGGNNNVRINNNTIENTDTGVHANNTNTNINIIKNIIDKGTSEGITVYGYSPQNIPSNFLIDSNIILYKQGSFGINIPYAKFGTITHNTIQYCLGGITLHDAVSVGSDDYYTSDMVIKNNAINNTGFGIIYVGNRTVVSNNIINAVQQDGINANNFNNTAILTSGVTISNNTITNPALAGGGRGGISVKNMVSSTVSNNVIRNCANSFAVRFNGNCSDLTINNNNCTDGMLQTTNTSFPLNITGTGNVFSNSYFPVSYPLTCKFNLALNSTKYTCDTTYNTAPDGLGVYDVNTFCVRTKYFIANGTIENVTPSWVGRTIILASSNYVVIKQGSYIKLKNNTDAIIPANNYIALHYDGTSWNEINRTF